MNILIRNFIALLVLGAGVAASSQAAVVTYNYSIDGSVLVGDETSPNTWGLTAGDTIVASGTFTADLSVGGDVTVSFGSGSGNSMSIDMLDGSFINASDDQNFAGGGYPQLVFNTGALTEFNMLVDSPYFSSNFTQFGDDGFLFGQWTSVSLSPVPLPAAAWLFGSALLGLGGMLRRRRA